MAEFEMRDDIPEDVAVQVVVRAEYLDGASEALEVLVDIHEDVSTEWAVKMLRRIADDLEAGDGQGDG